MFQTVHLASMSQVKLDAVVKFVKSDNVKQFKPGETNCPQPVGYSNAIECLHLRMAVFDQDVASKKDIYLAIENYIDEHSGTWHDYCAVMVKYFRNGYWNTGSVKGPVGFPVPPQVAPTGPCDLPLGYSQTIGSKIHSFCPEIPEDNWMGNVNGHDRVYQIVEALNMLSIELDLSLSQNNGSTVYIVLHTMDKQYASKDSRSFYGRGRSHSKFSR